MSKLIKLALCLSSAIMALDMVTAPLSYALNEQDYAANNIIIYDPNSSSCPVGGAGSVNTPAPSGSAFSLNEVKTFASEPISSTWNISDNLAEQWFLKQAGARATIHKYGLNSSNIGAISSAVKKENVSPVFFYLYTVNEGGGAGGFINHYSGDVGGGGVANATRDAKYLVTQSQVTNGTPATGGGEPANMPTQEAKQILSALPKGSIGIVYIQATSAVTAELETLSGKGPVNSYYGKPLSDAMKNIKTMGGNPADGGVPVSGTSPNGCTATVAGEGIQKAINWAVMIAKNDGYGYDQPTRTTGWTRWKSDPNCTSSCGSLDCSSFVSAALTAAGYFKENPNFVTSNEGEALATAGFKKVASSAKTSAGLQAGDILITDGHTEMYIGNNQNVGAHINENHGIAGGKTGDQTGHEISVGAFYNDNWNAVYRATK